MISTQTGKALTLTPQAYNIFADLVKFKPTEKQREFFSSPARFKVIVAGSRFGKSIISAFYVAAQLHFLPLLTGKPIRWWIVAPHYQLGEKEFRYAREFLYRAGEKIEVDSATYGNMKLILANGSELVVKTAERGHERGLLGDEMDGVLFSESAQIVNLKEIWSRYILRGLATRKGEALFPSTPKGYGFLYEIYERGKKREDKSWQSFGPYASVSGGGMSKDEFEYARKTLPREAFQEQYLGLFVAYSGRVYTEFSRDVHVIDFSKYFQPHQYRNYPMFVGIDFGYQNPSAAIFAIKVRDRFFVFDEIYGKHMILPEFAARLKQKLKRYNPTNVKIYADHDAGNRAWLRKEGFFTRPAKKDVIPGIQYVKRLLVGQDGKPALLISKKCENLIREFEFYHWIQNNSEERAPKEEPAKIDDHALDALRYLVFTSSGIRTKK